MGQNLIKRKIIKIDQDLCNGCGLCVDACHEGAIGMVNGKATLLRDDYCDGLGDCLPVCPTGAISFEERVTLPFDEKAVLLNKLEVDSPSRGCPGMISKTMRGSEGDSVVNKRDESEKQNVDCSGCREETLACGCPGNNSKSIEREDTSVDVKIASELRQWPVQIKLVPINAAYFSNANLLIAADCAPFAYADFHRKFMKNKITLVGCPKLDMVDYSQKLTEIIKRNDIKSVTVVRMEVPCCGGLEHAVKKAIMESGKFIPWQIITVSADGRILD